MKPKDVAETMRKAGEVQADPALAAIQELNDSVAASFDVLQSEDKKAQEQTEKLVGAVQSEIEKTRTEMAAGFKNHGEKIATLDRRSTALGFGGIRDVEGLCLAALGEEERRDISAIGWMQAHKDRDRERFPLMASAIGSTLIAHWLKASLLLQKRRFTSQAQEVELYARLAKYEKALSEAFQTEKAAAFLSTADTLGGHWLPDPVANELYRLILDNSVIGSQCTHVPMTTKTLDLPIEGSSALAISWGAENTTITDSVPGSNALNKVTLTASRINGYASSSMEEIQDSAISILSWVQTKLTEMAGRELDRVFLEGLVGVAPLFAGLGTAAGVNAFTTGANGDALTYLMLAQQVFKARERASRDNARWFASPELMAQIVGLEDTTGQPVVQFGNVPNRFAGSILGFPVEVHSVIKADRTYGTGTTLSNLYFGPPAALVMGDRMGMAWDVSDLPGFTTASVSMRLIARVGFGVAVPGAFSRHENIKT
jgi:HK97 family phage major capsid protein